MKNSERTEIPGRQWARITQKQYQNGKNMPGKYFIILLVNIAIPMMAMVNAYANNVGSIPVYAEKTQQVGPVMDRTHDLPQFILCGGEVPCMEPSPKTIVIEPPILSLKLKRIPIEPKISSNGNNKHEPISFNLLFESGSADIDEQEKNKISMQIPKLLNTESIHIKAYTDDQGSKQLNNALAAKRAAAVKKYLIRVGIDEKSVSLESYGKCCYVETNETSEKRSANRRVLVVTNSMVAISK